MFERLAGQLDAQLGRLENVLATELPRFNAELRRKKLPPIRRERLKLEAPVAD